MRTKKQPMLDLVYLDVIDGDREEFLDLFGPLGEDVRGLDCRIGEGVVELPNESCDPLDLILAAEELGVQTLNENGCYDARDPFQILNDAREQQLADEPSVLEISILNVPFFGILTCHKDGYTRKTQAARLRAEQAGDRDPVGERARQNRLLDRESLREVYSR